MVDTPPVTSISQLVQESLPFLRRYARALTGSQSIGDSLAAATLETIIADRSIFEKSSSNRVALYAAFDRIWSGQSAPVTDDAKGIEAAAQKHLRGLTPKTREALLLNTVEGFSTAEVAEIMAITREAVDHLLSVAMDEMSRSASGKALIIEDEGIIAMDLENAVVNLGHAVTGIATTHAEAIEMFQEDLPDLVISDIQLADMSSGVAAVVEMRSAQADIPVIFITAYPETLLTGEQTEPAFLIAKPYSIAEVRSAVSQAMFFASTETLDG